MKKLLQIGTVFFCMIMTSAFAQDAAYGASYNAPAGAPVGAPAYGASYNAPAYGASYGAPAGAPVGAPGQDYGSRGDNGIDYTTQEGGPCEHPCDQPANDCWCKYIRYRPCYYYTRRCVQDCYPCQRTCCRMVPQYYEVQKCRYVPQYYCEQACRMVPDYYTVCETKTCNRWVCDKHCRWVPECYWKHTCGDANCTTPCPSQPAAAGCPCPR